MTWEIDSFVHEKARATLAAIERRNWKILLVMVLASGLFRSPWLTASLALGGVISLGNFWGLRTIIEKAFRAKPLFLLALFFKMAALLGLLFLLIVYANVNKIAFAVGISVAFLSVTWEGFKGYFKARQEG